MSRGLGDVYKRQVSASSLLGFYIGVQTGADMERHISDSKLPEQILNAFQELNE